MKSWGSQNARALGLLSHSSSPTLFRNGQSGLFHLLSLRHLFESMSDLPKVSVQSPSWQLPWLILTVSARTVLWKGDIGATVAKEAALEIDSVTICLQDLSGKTDCAVVLILHALSGSQLAAGVAAF